MKTKNSKSEDFRQEKGLFGPLFTFINIYVLWYKRKTGGFMMQEILNWMCEYMTFWYVDYGDYKEVLYPITKEKQDKVLSILDMRSDSLIYNNNFYSLSKDIIMTTDKASYTYYLKKSSYYKKQKALKLLPYNLNDSSVEVIKKLSNYYQHYKLPFILLIIKSELDVKALITNYLNTITYLNLTEGQLINHADIETLVGDKLFLLLSNNKTNNFNQIIIDILDKNKINYEIYKDDISFLTKINFVSKQPK